MSGEPRMTLSTLAVLAALLQQPSQPLYGLEIARAADLASGSLYPILARLEKAGWVESYWEDVDPESEGRPRRRYYRLTGVGASKAVAARASAVQRLGSHWLKPQGGNA